MHDEQRRSRGKRCVTRRTFLEYPPDPAAEAIPSDRRANPAGDRIGHAQPIMGIGRGKEPNPQIGGANLHARRAERRERRPIGDTPDQAASFWRPLRRRFFRISRPARVDIRERKPCFLARLRTLGWYVRFISSPNVGGVASVRTPDERSEAVEVGPHATLRCRRTKGPRYGARGVRSNNCHNSWSVSTPPENRAKLAKRSRPRRLVWR